MSALREAILKDGAAVVPGVLTADEIAQLRQAVYGYFNHAGRSYDFGKTQPDAFARVPECRWLITHSGILAAVREAAGRDDVQFTFHSDCHMNMLSGWHTDTQAYFTPDEVARDDFEVLKVGIYLQDHTENAQGLTIDPGSHQTGKLNPANAKAVPTKAGDIIVFDVRTYHHGDKKKLWEKLLGKAIRSETAKYALGKRIRSLTGRIDKLSIFFTYGVPNDQTLEFSRRNMARQNKQNKLDHSRPPADLVSALRLADLPMAEVDGVSESLAAGV